MSRIGKIPVKVPSGVKVTFANDEMTLKDQRENLNKNTTPLSNLKTRARKLLLAAQAKKNR